jgi:prepilin-type N-terminal cleavage/methylation domain-containing protein
MSVTNDDRGFTMVELAVVVLIVAVLLASAIPTFRGAQVVAQDRAAQSDLMSALDAARAILADGNRYPARSSAYRNTVSAMSKAEPGLDFARWRTVAAADVVGVASDGTVMQMQVLSESGTAYCIYDYVDHSRRGTSTWYLHGNGRCNRSGW